MLKTKSYGHCCDIFLMIINRLHCCVLIVWREHRHVWHVSHSKTRSYVFPTYLLPSSYLIWNACSSLHSIDSFSGNYPLHPCSRYQLSFTAVSYYVLWLVALQDRISRWTMKYEMWMMKSQRRDWLRNRMNQRMRIRINNLESKNILNWIEQTEEIESNEDDRDIWSIYVWITADDDRVRICIWIWIWSWICNWNESISNLELDTSWNSKFKRDLNVASNLTFRTSNLRFKLKFDSSFYFGTSRLQQSQTAMRIRVGSNMRSPNWGLKSNWALI